MSYKFINKAASRYEFLDDEPSPGPSRRYVNPNRGRGTGELLRAGAGRFVDDMGLGARQLMESALAAAGNPAAQANVPVLEGIADARKMDPTLRTTAGQIGYTGAALAPAVMASAVPGANTILGAGAIGAGMGLFQPVGKEDSRAINTGIGGASGMLGQGAFNLVGRIAQPVKSALTQAERRAVELLRNKGVSLSVGQQTGSRAAQALERTLADNPASAPAMARAGERFRDTFTRAVLRTAGENADTATPEVLGRAARRIGLVFDEIAARYDLDITTPQVANLLNQLDRRAKVELLNDPRIATQIDTLRQAAQQHGGKLPGEAYKNVKTTLDNLSRQQNIGPYAAELREILDDALNAATRGTRDFTRLKEARSQYRNLMAIADAADTTANGRVSPAALAQRLKSNKYTRNSMRFGRGDAELARLARAGSTVVDRFPNSGTATRAAQQLGIPALAGAVGYAASGDPETAAKVAAGMWALPKVGGALMSNPAVQGYLSSGVTQPLLRGALTGPSRLGLGALVPAYLLAQE